MSIIESHRKGRQRGGRRARGMPEYNKVKYHIVVDQDLWNMLEIERHAGETNNEALWRMLRGRTTKIHNLQKKCDALENVILLRNPGQEVSIQLERN